MQLFVVAAFLLLSIRVKTQVISYKEFEPGSGIYIRPGANNLKQYLPTLKGKSIAIVANQTSMVGKTHLVDTLIKLGIKIKKVFGPEHGFRGEADAGEKVNTGVDAKTKLPLISLYGKNKKPTNEQLSDVELVIFDIQDVGCRFYTYISTLTYTMEACAENGKELIVLDRPNPNGHYVDGPILESEFQSFVGLHPVPIVHGCTVGEYAQMVKGQGWIKNASTLKLTVVAVEGWNHKLSYSLPVRPSPNLPNDKAVWLYPSLCLFEGTTLSVGRGTNKPFQCIGYPKMPDGKYTFTPRSLPGAKSPPYLDTICNGFLLEDFAENYLHDLGQLYLFWLLESYKTYPKKELFFTSFFEKLAGTANLRIQIIDGKSEEEIRKSWQKDLKDFKTIRKKYLLYPDFE